MENKIMEKIAITIGMIFVIAIIMFIFVFKKEDSNNQEEMVLDENIEIEEVSNSESRKLKETKSEELSEMADWNIYKNEKYKYSFKYPKNWYLYEGKNYPNQNERCNLYANTESPWNKLNEFSEYDVILSKTKLDDCSIGSLEDGSFGGNFSISTKGWMGGSINEDIAEIEKNGGVGEYGDEIFMFGEVKAKMTKSKYLDENDPKKISFWAITDKFNYSVMIIQEDNKKEIDSNLMKVANSLVIEE